MKLKKSDKEQLKALRNGGYDDASIHTILLDLCLDTGVDDVFLMLHMIASDMRKKGKLKEAMARSKDWKWPKYK